MACLLRRPQSVSHDIARYEFISWDIVRSVDSSERGVGAREMGTAHCMEIGGQKPRSPFSLAPQSPSNFCFGDSQYEGGGHQPKTRNKQTNKSALKSVRPTKRPVVNLAVITESCLALAPSFETKVGRI